MKKYLVFTFLIVLGCKTIQPNRNQLSEAKENIDCVLSFLAKTQDYENQIDTYRSVYHDTIIEIESKDFGANQYKTILNLRSEEYYLWLLRIKYTNVDSLLIHCITASKSVDSDFDFENCKIQVETNEYDEIGNPILGKSEFIDF
jgi:hypothetical protein